MRDGTLDAAGRVLILHAEGPSMAAEGAMTQDKDVSECTSAEHRVLTSHMLSEDGAWHECMTAHYRRLT